MQSAGKFTCHVPTGFAQHQRRILYIGKATAGDFAGEDPGARWFNQVDSAFWHLARKISTLADPDCTDLSNLAWSNLFKHGVQRGNPSGKFAEEQRPAATQALRDEILQYKPTLIVLVNAGYYEEIPKAAFEIIDGEAGSQALTRTEVLGEDKWDLWSRPSYDIFPPIVWMYHPQGKRSEYTDAALTLIQRVTDW